MNGKFAVDSSVVIAILKGEPEAKSLEQALLQDRSIASWATLFEIRIWLLRNLSDELRTIAEDWVFRAVSEIVPFEQNLEQAATDAYRRFGKGRHPAGLNYGDCMAYATAMHHHIPLLFKGSDFGRTDVEIHPASIVM